MIKKFQDNAFKFIAYAGIFFFTLFSILPVIEVISVSLSDEKLVNVKGYSIIPRNITLHTYSYIVRDGFDWIVRSYANTFFVVITGTVLAVFITSMLAFTISSKEVKYRKLISFFSYITMVFSAGLVPYYVTCIRLYNFSDKYYALILPYLVNTWFLFILKRFFSNIPESLLESAKIDGAKPVYIFFNVVVPLSKTAIITITMFYAIQYWNDWWLALLFLKNKKLFTLQYQLYNLLANAEIMNSFQSNAAYGKTAVPKETVKMAVTVITIGPIVFLYPFIQKYFIKGILVGALKE